MVHYYRTLVTLLDQELERARRYDRACTILFMDIDHFNALNDGYGHAAGDTVLRDFATRVDTNLRAIDTIGRWGGEEFVAILPEATAEEAYAIVERVRAASQCNPSRWGRTQHELFYWYRLLSFTRADARGSA